MPDKGYCAILLVDWDVSSRVGWQDDQRGALCAYGPRGRVIPRSKAISGKYYPHCLPPAGGGWRGAQRGQCSLESPRPLAFPPPPPPPPRGGGPCCSRED